MTGRRPLYFRLLRVHHLTVAPWVAFALFEGSFAVAILLALAEVVNFWGLLAIPVAVAVMVKVNDVVAGAMLEPLADAQLRTPGILPRRATGWSTVPRTGRPTTEISDDDAVADPAAAPDGVVRGVAHLRYRGVASASHARRPRPSSRTPEPPMPDHAPVETIVTRIVGPTGTDGPSRPDAADRRSRGNQGRFSA